MNLGPHQISIALMQPQIAPNTGNIARLCVATGTRLHLVRPMGFVLSDRNLKRSAMDYWDRLQLTVHDDEEAFSHQSIDCDAGSLPQSLNDHSGMRNITTAIAWCLAAKPMD